MYHYSRSLKLNADSADKKLHEMNTGDWDFQQQTDTLGNLREQLRLLDAEIADEKVDLCNWKRVRAREWMGVLFGGLLKCSEKGTVVATFSRDILEYVPTEMPQPGLPRAHYSGHSHVESLVTEAERTLYKLSSVSQVCDGTLQPSKGFGTGDVPGNPFLVTSSPIQPTPVQTPIQPIQLHASSTLPSNPPSIPHEPGAFGEGYPHPRSQTYADVERTSVPSSGQPTPGNPTISNPFTPFHPLNRGHQPDHSTEQELPGSFGEIGDGSLQLPNGPRIGDTTGLTLPLAGLPDQPVPTQPPPPYTLSELPIDPPSNPHEPSVPGEFNPHSLSQTPIPAQQTHLSLSDEPLPMNPVRSSSVMSLPPPRRSDLTRDIPGLPSSSSTLPSQPTPGDWLTQWLVETEEQIRLDAEFAEHLQAMGDTSESHTDAAEVQETNGCAAERLSLQRRDFDCCYSG